MRWNKTLTVVDCHAGGESGQVVTGGVIDVPGKTAFDKRVYLQDHMDDLRKMILFEPRGAAHHNANIILPSNNPEAQMAYVILESTEYPAMSGSNTMCVATVLLETGIIPMQEPVTRLVLESPAGLISVECRCKDGKVEEVRFINQPAFAYHLDQKITVEGIGEISIDVAYGGMTYALVDAHSLGFKLDPAEARDLCTLGMKIKRAAAEQLPVVHPENPAIPGITQTQFTGPLERNGATLTSRNAVICSPGRTDRSPCGTGTSARLAVLHAKGLIKPGEEFTHESIIGSKFSSSIVKTARVGDYNAVIPTVAGTAWITGVYQMGMDPSDPFPQGFTLGDTWLGIAGDPVLTAADS
ncbi:proline racemase family protein (plasmid) [Arthrobacter sp. UC242_113]|uniref:proline racemase family protein n=1 Tax=Arthrobacter sp. UC242_113 TaxID=3374550 RepID=UPI003756526C